VTDLLTQGGVGSAGALFGGLLSWLGFKQRLDAQDKRIDTLADAVMYEDTCEARCGGMEKQVENQNVLLTEMRGDIKKLLKRKS
jgi:hypothetical protein